MPNIRAPIVDTAYLVAQVAAFDLSRSTGIAGFHNLFVVLVLVHLCVAVAFVALCGGMPRQIPPAGLLKRWRTAIRWGRLFLVCALLWYGQFGTAAVLLLAMCLTAAAWHHLEVRAHG